MRATNVCVVTDCEARAKARGYCNKHYVRWFRTGDPTGVKGRPRRDPAERFWEKVEKSDDCWLWTSALDGDGYGLFQLHSQTTVRAHRYAYEQLVGPIPDGLTLDHLCRVVHCVNPAHLEPVTNQENARRERAAHRESR